MTLNYSVGILGNMDISQFKSGINQIKQDLGDVDTQTKKSGTTLGKFQKGLAGGLAQIKNLSFAAAGALTTIGLAAPSLSGAMSRIKTEALRTTEIFGREMQPKFEAFANGWQSFNGWLDAHPTFKKVSSNALAFLGIFGLLKGAFSGLKWMFGGLFKSIGNVLFKSQVMKAFWKGIPGFFTNIGTKLWGVIKGIGVAITGFLTTTVGAVLSSLLAGIGGGWLAQKITNAIGWTSDTAKGAWETTKRVGVAAGGGALAGAGAGALIGALGGPIGAGAGALIGGAGGLLYGGGKELYNYFTKSGAYEESAVQNTTTIPVSNNIFLDGSMIAQQSSIYQNQQMSYFPGGGR
mgnify:CR=1 FL=1